MDRRYWHRQLPGNLAQSQTSPFKLQDRWFAFVKRGWPAQTNAAGFCGFQARIDPLLDDTAFELGHRHQDVELEPPRRTIRTGIYTLPNAHQGDLQPVHFIQDESQVSQAAP